MDEDVVTNLGDPMNGRNYAIFGWSNNNALNGLRDVFSRDHENPALQSSLREDEVNSAMGLALKRIEAGQRQRFLSKRQPVINTSFEGHILATTTVGNTVVSNFTPIQDGNQH
ncbi:hypothetical protein Ddc_12165 [Ditylenchus destructor]|nr:hypothetical protein Ddc_12165 [Ditylenchus destructor]